MRFLKFFNRQKATTIDTGIATEVTVIENPKKLGLKRKRQGGFVLSTEYVIVIAAATAILVGVFSTMGDSDDERVVSEAITTMTKASENLRARMQGFADYSDVDNTTCYDSQIFPSSWKSDTQDQFTTSFSDDGLTCGSVDTATNKAGVTSTGTGKYHTFTLTGVETDQCNQLVAGLIDKFVEIDVNATRIDSNTTLTTQCAASTSNTVLLINR